MIQRSASISKIAQLSNIAYIQGWANGLNPGGIEPRLCLNVSHHLGESHHSHRQKVSRSRRRLQIIGPIPLVPSNGPSGLAPRPRPPTNLAEKTRAPIGDSAPGYPFDQGVPAHLRPHGALAHRPQCPVPTHRWQCSHRSSTRVQGGAQ